MRISLEIRAMPATVLLGCLVIAACTPPKAPEEERRPEPQAQPKSALVETANTYKGAAHASATATEDAAKREKAKLDAVMQ